MKKHPGIIFTIWTIVTCFLLGIEFALVEMPSWIEGSILFFWASMCFFWVTYFHVQWIMKLDAKYYKKEKRNG